jgi:purine-binding chemotaxis protein CheW
MTGRLDWKRARERLERARIALQTVDSPEDERALLEARARELAAPIVEEHDADWRDVVVFVLGGERFAAAAEHVLEALPLGEPTPVPGTPELLLGVVNHRGRVLPVMDLRRRLVPGGALDRELTHTVAVSVGGMTFGIAAEDVEETSREHAGARDLAPLTVLDLEELAADPRLRIDDDLERR